MDAKPSENANQPKPASDKPLAAAAAGESKPVAAPGKGPNAKTLAYISASSRKLACEQYPNGKEIVGDIVDRLRLWDGEYNTACDICAEGGELILCDFCNIVYHPACFYPPLEKIPEGHWACPECSLQIDKLSRRSVKRAHDIDYESYSSGSEGPGEEEEEEDDDEDADGDDNDDDERPRKKAKKSSSKGGK